MAGLKGWLATGGCTGPDGKQPEPTSSTGTHTVTSATNLSTRQDQVEIDSDLLLITSYPNHAAVRCSTQQTYG